MNAIITQLENYDLHRQALTSATENLHTAVSYFFDQIETKPSWSKDELFELRDRCLIPRGLEAVESALKVEA